MHTHASPKRQLFTRAELASALPVMLGAVVCYPIVGSKEPVVIRVLMSLFGGAVLTGIAYFATIVGQWIVAAAAQAEIPPAPRGLDVRLSGAALLLIALWGLGHYWAYQRERTVLGCVDEIAREGPQSPWFSAGTNLSDAVRWCVKSKSDTSADSSDE